MQLHSAELDFRVTSTAKMEELAVPITLHVDTISGLLAWGSKQVPGSIYIKGRVIDSDEEQSRLLEDEVVTTFLSLRSEDRLLILLQMQEMGYEKSSLPRLEVTAGQNGPYKSAWYDLSALSQQWEEAKLLPTHLVPIFGGASLIELASNTERNDLTIEVRKLVFDRQADHIQSMINRLGELGCSGLIPGDLIS